MSDDESFVILGSSPMSSLESNGIDAIKRTNSSSLESNATSSSFSSLKNSQIRDLKNAQDIAAQKSNQQPEMSTPLPVAQLTESIVKSIEVQENENKEQEIAASKIWNRQLTCQAEKNVLALSLEDCALKSPLEKYQKEEEIFQEKTSTPVSQKEPAKNEGPALSVNNNLATSFIMGEVDSDVLKTSVYSQFPSISMEASAEDVIKLQNMVSEYSQLKATIRKANNTMKLFYEHSMQWKNKMKTMEEEYKQQLDDCKKEIEELRKQNNQIEANFKMQIEALEIALKKDREENVKEMSAKNALLENMRSQIIKLEQQQLASFEYVENNRSGQQNDNFNEICVTQLEQEHKIKDLERQLSEMVSSNLDFKYVEKQYIDELNCLKVNLTAAEELIQNNRAELTALNIKKDQEIKALEASLKSLEHAFEEQKERILLLEAQNEVHRADFEMEKQSREAAINEKQQILHDLRSLQKKNQELIEEHQKMADGLQKRLTAVAANNDAQLTASVAAQTYLQNPITALPSSTATSVAKHMCPICNKAFKSLHILLSHVNDCVDKN